MYNAATIKTDFMGLVGWRQGDPAISASLVQSDSGLYYNSEHPLLTLENLRAIAPQSGDFNAWLTQQTEDGILKAVQRYLSEKLASQAAKGILDRRVVYPLTTAPYSVEKTGKMIGFEVYPFPVFGVVAVIDRISTAFESAVDINVKLWHSTQKDPVETVTLNHTKPGSVQWHNLTEALTLDLGSAYYLTYDQPAGVAAIGQKRPATYHGRYPRVSPYMAEVGPEAWDYTDNKYSDDRWAVYYGKYLRVAPFIHDIQTEIWDPADNEHTDYTGGLNMQVSVKTDFTTFLSDQRDMFKDLIAKQVAIGLLRQMAFNPSHRINSSTGGRTDILYELDGDSTGVKKSGLKYEYDRVLEGLLLDTEKLDNIIFSKKRKSVRFNSI